jgi:hypothetical protein
MGDNLLRNVLLLPAVERLLRDAEFARELGHRQAQLGLLEYRHDLFHRKSPLHGQSPHPSWGNPPKN